ncbi:MAG: replicative DNA helicase, partial [Brevundimonas sp.]
MNALSPISTDARPVAALPHNLEAEQALLGSLMFDNAVFERLSDRLRGTHFYEPFHQRLFDAIEDHVRQGLLAEPTILMERFKADPAFQEFGGLRYLADLVDRAPPGANAPDYARLVYDLALRRDLIRIGGDIIKEAPDPETPAMDQIEAAEQSLYSLAETGKPSSGFVSFGHALAGAVEMAGEAYQRDGKLAGLATYLDDLDQKLGGLHPSDLLILAGRPSMGKTALATNIAFNVARNYRWEPTPEGRKTVEGGVVAFYSLEMSAEQLAMRILADASGVSSDRLRKGEIDASDFGRIRDAAAEIGEAPLYIDATGGLSLSKLAARARRLKRMEHGLDLIIVDYLQLITVGEGNGQKNRVQEVSEITGGLKALAKELSVPIIALSQLSRQVEQREDKRPQLS